MTIAAYDVGDVVRVGNQVGANPDGVTRNAFATLAGTATDPTLTTLEVRKPDGTVLTYHFPSTPPETGVLTRESAGRFYFDVALTAHGLWKWRLEGTGAVETAEEGALFVRRSSFS